jgi:hypothetical protein
MLRFVARGLIARQNDFPVLRPRANAKMIAELAQQARFPAIFQRRETKDAFP